MGKAAVSSFLANEQRTAQKPEPANPDGHLVTHTCPREILNWWDRIGQTWKEQVSGGGSSCFIFFASAGQGVTGRREWQHHCWGAGPCQGCQAPMDWAGGAIKPRGTAQGQQGWDLAWGRTSLLHLPGAPWLATSNS